jgi:hypothetical protein
VRLDRLVAGDRSAYPFRVWAVSGSPPVPIS